MDSAEKNIKEKIDSFSIEQAREFVATYHGSPDSQYGRFARDCLATKEAKVKDVRNTEMLSTISSKNKTWYEKPIGIVLLTAIAGLIIAFLVYRFGWH